MQAKTRTVYPVKEDQPLASQSVPLNPSELTLAWVRQTLMNEGFLQQASDLKNIRVEACGKQGATSQVFFIHLDTTQSDLPKTVVAKFSSADDAIRQSMGKSYRNEVNFYRYFGKQVGVPVPDCYFAHYNAETHHSLLVLAFIPNASAVQAKQITWHQLEQLTRLLADLHAKWWRQEAYLGTHGIEDEQSPPLLAFRKQHAQSAMAIIHEHFLDRPGAQALMSVLGLWLMYTDLISDYIKSQARTLCHNDFYPNQVSLSHDSDESCYLFDWQDQAIALSLDDLACLISHMIPAWPKHEQAKHEHALIVDYYGKLRTRLPAEEAYTFQQCAQNYNMAVVKQLIRQVNFLSFLGMRVMRDYWQSVNTDPTLDMWSGIYGHHSQAVSRTGLLSTLRQITQHSEDHSLMRLLSLNHGFFRAAETRELAQLAQSASETPVPAFSDNASVSPSFFK